MKDVYIRRHLGEEAARFAHPSLEKVLKETHGVMLYQEDVLRVARAAAGFTLTEADTLRKAMTKKRTQGLMRGLRKRFVAGALERGLSGEDAERIFSNMEGFASYSFCKAHAVTYGLIAFEAAYLKAHFPAELMAAVIANGGGFYGSGVYVEEARRLGVRILPPGVNHSVLDCRSERAGERGAIRPGLGQVAGLSQGTIEAILRERAKRPFLSLADFLQRVEPAAGEAEALVLCGAFDFTDLARPELLWRLKTGFNDPERGSARAPAERQLFGPLPMKAGRPLPPIPDYDLSKKLELEYEFLGFTPTCHPMTLFASLAEQERALPCARLADLVGRRVKTAGWAVAARRVRTARGRLMKFITLEDSSGVVEATLFPEAYRRLGHLTVGGGPYLAEGVMESRQGFPSLNIKELRPLGASDDGSAAWEEREE
jgi:DNA polymerase III alpha subunit